MPGRALEEERTRGDIVEGLGQIEKKEKATNYSPTCIHIPMHVPAILLLRTWDLQPWNMDLHTCLV